MGNRRRGTSRPWWAAAVLAYVTAGVAAHFVPVKLLGDLTVAAYVVAEVGGLSFIVRYARTDWRAHPWGRHVMTFMVCCCTSGSPGSNQS